MGELHLEIYVERMRREYNVACTTGKPRVAFRETITQRAEFNYTHKKQTGGAGQFARVIGNIEPMEYSEDLGRDVDFVNVVMGGNIPTNFIPAVEKVRRRSYSKIDHVFMLSYRAFMRRLRRVHCRVTPSLAAASCSRMALSMLWTRLNLLSETPLLVHSAKLIKIQSRSFLSLS